MVSNDVGGTLAKHMETFQRVAEFRVSDDELSQLLNQNKSPVCVDAFEPSGRMHLGQGILKALVVNQLADTGCTFKFWMADWISQQKAIPGLDSSKMKTEMEKARTIGQYMIEVWKAIGMRLDKVEVVWASEVINARANEYWPILMDIVRYSDLPRIFRCLDLADMGDNGQLAKEHEELPAADLLYPCMTCASLFLLKADIGILGMDKKNVGLLAREYCDDIQEEHKPIIISHNMLPGLGGQMKMSKAQPESCIFMEDDENEVKKKIKGAFCPPNIVEGNPCIDYVKYIVLPWRKQLLVERPEKHGGNKLYESIEDLINDYKEGALHPGDLKPALVKSLNEILQPVRNHFKNDAKAKALLDKVKKYKVARS